MCDTTSEFHFDEMSLHELQQYGQLKRRMARESGGPTRCHVFDCFNVPDVACVICNGAMCDSHMQEVQWCGNTLLVCEPCTEQRFQGPREVYGLPTYLTREMEAFRAALSAWQAAKIGPLPF